MKAKILLLISLLTAGCAHHHVVKVAEPVLIEKPQEQSLQNTWVEFFKARD
jgi:hypothetical protein